jgi:prepilin-type N-terminal cleavage/methylation domain-containing protein
MHEDGRSAGFTLIETLVALVIFVAGYLLIQQSVSLGWQGALAADAEKAALRVARTRMAVAGTEIPLEEGQRTGRTSDGYRWTATVGRYKHPAIDGSAVSIAAFWVTIDVRWNEGASRASRSLQLTTIKLGSVQ